MREIVSFVSEGWTLHGVVHSPRAVPELRVGVVLFHENFNTKFGPHQLYRRLAEALAEVGFYALRYDSRGTCDSPGQCELSFADRVADARAAIRFFRNQYQLDALVGWGLCMGAAVAVHSAAEGRPGQERPDGLVLCNILADPADASLPQFGYNKVDLPGLARDLLRGGNLLRKLWQAPRKLPIYRKSIPKLAASLLRRYRSNEPELDRLCAAVGRVGELLAGYAGPCLLLFGEKDTYRRAFFEQVNVDDRLGLARRKLPPAWATVRDGDHTFASAEQTAEMIGYTLNWLEGFRRGLDGSANSSPGEKHGLPASSVAD